MRKLDSIDRKILTELQANGRLSVVELASRVNLTKTPCSHRLKRLEEDGVISGYAATVSPRRVNMNHVTIVQVNMAETSDKALRAFNEAVKNIPEIQICLMIAGSFDYILKVRTRDMVQFRELLGEKIAQLPYVMQTHSFAVMETVKESSTIPLHSREEF